MVLRLERPAGASNVKRLSLLFVLLLAVFQIVAAPNSAVERISRKDLKPAKDGMPGEQEWNKEIIISPTIKFQARIEVTNKGNGVLEIGNLKLHG